MLRTMQIAMTIKKLLVIYMLIIYIYIYMLFISPCSFQQNHLEHTKMH